MEDFMLFQKFEGFNNEIDELFAIFDGHGGYIVSLFSKVVFPEVLKCNINKFVSLNPSNLKID